MLINSIKIQCGCYEMLFAGMQFTAIINYMTRRLMTVNSSKTVLTQVHKSRVLDVLIP
jgi:hypothetical protein